MKRVFALASFFIAFFILWYVADIDDYFKDKFPTLTPDQEALFDWTDVDSSNRVKQTFEKHFKDSTYRFPRSAVSQVKVYRNKAILGTLTCKTLKSEHLAAVVLFCNNPDNFDWGETTWTISEAEYVFKFFDANENIIGKLYVCLDDCGMVAAMPFTPNMKFGQLSSSGKKEISRIIQRYDW